MHELSSGALSDEIKSQISKEFDVSILQNEHHQRQLELEQTLSKTKSKDWEMILCHHQQAGII